jgi:hypothetical protein
MELAAGDWAGCQLIPGPFRPEGIALIGSGKMPTVSERKTMRVSDKQACSPFRAKISAAPVFLLLTALAISAASFPLHAAQQKKAAAKTNPRAFVGTWTAAFQGKTFMTLWVARNKEGLTAEMSNGEMSFDADGNIAAVTQHPGKKAVKILKIEGNALYLLHGDSNPLRLAFRLKDKNHAELAILNPTPKGVAPLKPIPMVRETAKQ